MIPPKSQPEATTSRPTRCCAPPTATRVRPAAAIRYAQIFKALGDPTRLEILGVLAAAADTLCACEIEARFDLKQPTISHHLRILREAGLVTAERHGLWVHYTFERGRLQEAMSLVDAFG